jgi:REP element-mobilizing transposase RayT
MGSFRKSSATNTHRWDGRHRFEHWYRDNTVYFITSRCRDRYPAFKSEKAKQIFWDRFHFYADRYGFVPWITTLLDNHYHTVGYLYKGENLGPFMQKFHGSVAKLVNDILPERRVPFFRRAGNQDYFDGCLRDEKQTRRAYCYTRLQAVRARIVRRPEDYPHTHVAIDLDRAVRRAIEKDCFLARVPYARYERP